MAPRSPLLAPGEYFERTRHDHQLTGLVVFVAFVIVQLAMFVSLFNLVLDQVENAPPEFDRAVDQAASELLESALFFGFVGALVGLLVVAAVMHYLSGGSDTTGTFGDAIAVAGWAYAPNLLLAPLGYAHARYEIQRKTFDGSDPQVLQRELEAVQADGGGAIPVLLSILVIAWSVYILAYGIAATHDVDVDDTLLPAAIVGLGAFFFGTVL